MVGSWFGVKTVVGLREAMNPEDAVVGRGTLVGVVVAGGAGVVTLLGVWTLLSMVEDLGRLSPAFEESAWKRLYPRREAT